MSSQEKGQKLLAWLGCAEIMCYAALVVQYAQRRQLANALWACHLGALAVGIGLMLRWPACIAVGTYWLTLGVPLWVYYLATGGEFLVLSLLTHAGGLAGYAGLKKLGLPEGIWWKAALAIVLLHVVSRWVTPPEENVNLAHAIHPGWESTFHSHTVYALALLALTIGVFVMLQFGLRRLGFETPVNHESVC
jgi:hypothetical protein